MGRIIRELKVVWRSDYSAQKERTKQKKNEQNSNTGKCVKMYNASKYSINERKFYENSKCSTRKQFSMQNASNKV